MRGKRRARIPHHPPDRQLPLQGRPSQKLAAERALDTIQSWSRSVPSPAGCPGTVAVPARWPPALAVGSPGAASPVPHLRTRLESF